MEGEWDVARVGDLADSISDTHPREKERLIFLNTSDVLNGKILHRSYSRVAKWPGQAKKSIRRFDILFSEIRPANGRWAYVDFDARDFVVSTKLMVIRPKSEKIFPRFLYHFLTSAQTTRWLQHLAESRSGTFPQITFDQVAELEIGLPSLDSQRRIASFLDCLGDKIELNRQMNEALEAMARGLFKSWFVDFAPVYAKAEGRDPGLPKQIADLFPDSFEDSELSEIPTGWTVKPFLDVGRLISGGTPKTKIPEYWHGEIAWASAKDVSQCGEAFLLETERTITPLGLEKSSTRLVPPMSTVVVARGATTGRFTMFGSEMAMNQTCYALKSVSGHDFWLSNTFANLVESLVNAAHGSVFDTITTRTLSSASIVDPGVPLRNSFENFTRPVYERLLNNLEQTQILSSLRDTLLPQLISGSTRIGNPDRFLERDVAS